MFSQLLGILVRALPTFILVVLLHLYLKRMLFLPLDRVMSERARATEGVVKESEETVHRTAERMREYEASLSAARAELYKEFEEHRAVLLASQEAAVQRARDNANARLEAARTELAEEVERSRASLASEVEVLSQEISDMILAGGRS